MYEVIWSKFSNKFIVRSIAYRLGMIYSTVKPLFLGTEEECNKYIAINTLC